MSDQMAETTIPEDLREVYQQAFDEPLDTWAAWYVRQLIERTGRAEEALREILSQANNQNIDVSRKFRNSLDIAKAALTVPEAAL